MFLANILLDGFLTLFIGLVAVAYLARRAVGTIAKHPEGSANVAKFVGLLLKRR